jgi:hypothetical protein
VRYRSSGTGRNPFIVTVKAPPTVGSAPATMVHV